MSNNYNYQGIGYAQDKQKEDVLFTGVPGGGVPLQRVVVAQAQGDRTMEFRVRNQGGEAAALELVAKGGVHAITGESLGAGPLSDLSGQTIFRNIVPGTFAVTGGATETFSDLGTGILLGSAGGSGTINYTTGVFTLNWNTNSGAGAVVLGYSHTDWAPFGTPITRSVAVGGGEVVITMEPTSGANYATGIKGNPTIGLAASAPNAGTQIQVISTHLGIDTGYRLEDPRELLRGPIDARTGPQTITQG
jgi:hypothetical protein